MNDLIKRLRDLGDHAEFAPHMHHLAADRIEELEKGRERLLRAMTDNCVIALELGEKLAKAVEALRVSLEGLNWAKAYLSTSGIDSVSVNHADATVYTVLAELEGQP